jgi:hypothetical protein
MSSMVIWIVGPPVAFQHPFNQSAKRFPLGGLQVIKVLCTARLNAMSIVKCEVN